MRTFFQTYIAPHTNQMFGTPVRDNTGSYIVPLLKPYKANVLIELNKDGLVPTLSYQTALQGLKISVVEELTKCRQIFKNPPTLQSLLAITPNWGFIAADSGVKLSPYTKVNVEVGDTPRPCLVDFVLEAVSISPATLQPIFRVEFVNSVSDVIDFEWTPVKDELEEVSDVTDTDAGTLTLTDPAAKRKAKLEAKQRIREAFRLAAEASRSACDQADQFLEEYELSDSESAFSEWMSDDESP